MFKGVKSNAHCYLWLCSHFLVFFAISCSLAFLLVAIFSIIEDIEEFEPQYECDSLEEFLPEGRYDYSDGGKGAGRSGFIRKDNNL